jgi:hypothetical protein
MTATSARLVSTVTPAHSSGLNPPYFSVATIDTSGFHGVETTRWDRNIDAGDAYCYHGPVASTPIVWQYQSITMTNYPGDSLGLLTEHHNPSCKDWLWGFWSGGVWYETGRVTNIGYAQHAFRIIRGGNGVDWAMQIDVSTMGWIHMADTGKSGAVGLNSNTGLTTVSAHGYYYLKYDVGGPWYDWVYPGPLYNVQPAPANAAFGQSVDTPEMCGRYLPIWPPDHSSWQAGEYTTCN